jgi:hypothetical protein
MKKQALTIVGVLSLLLAAGSAFAQMNGPTIQANIPFKFVVDRQALPAGDYTISRLGNSEPALVIRSADGKEVKIALCNRLEALQPAAKTKLVFRRYGTDRYFLSQVWVAGSDSGRQLPKSAHENEVAMDFTSSDVIVMASLR